MKNIKRDKLNKNIMMVCVVILSLIICLDTDIVFAKNNKKQPDFFSYLQYSGKYYGELEEGFSEEISLLGKGDSEFHRLYKKFEGLPGEWYTVYSYYIGYEEMQDGVLSDPFWMCLPEKGDINEIKNSLQEIYGEYNEKYINPISNSEIPYVSYLWYSVEDDTYSLCLTETDQMYEVKFLPSCHFISKEEILNAAYIGIIESAGEGLMEKDYQELKQNFKENLEIDIEEYTRLNSEYVLMIATNDLGMPSDELINDGTATGEYVWTKFSITEKDNKDNKLQSYNVILKRNNDEWKIYGELQETID